MPSCPVCANGSCKFTPLDPGNSALRYMCPRCGSFTFYGTALNFLEQRVEEGRIDISVLSHYLRKMQRPEGPSVEIFEEDLMVYIDDTRLPSPQEQLDNLVLLVGNAQPSPASYAGFTIEEIAAHIGSAIDTRNSNEPNFAWLWSEIAENGLFRKESGPGKLLLKLTMPGWELFEKLPHGYHFVES